MYYMINYIITFKIKFLLIIKLNIKKKYIYIYIYNATITTYSSYALFWYVDFTLD